MWRRNSSFYSDFWVIALLIIYPTNNWNSPKNVNSGEIQEKLLSHWQQRVENTLHHVKTWEEGVETPPSHVSMQGGHWGVVQTPPLHQSVRGRCDSCKGNPSHFRSQFAPCTYHSWPAIASDPPSASAALVCHVTRYLTHTYTYLLILVLFIISVTLYISPYPQEDPYPFLFRSPTRYVHV